MADYKDYYEFRPDPAPVVRYAKQSDFDELKKRVENLENPTKHDGDSFDDRDDLMNRIAILEAEKLSLLNQIKSLKDAGDKMAAILRGFK